jgi:phosphatidylglycerol---prolipoprotein diacylglyceryl transferase
MVDGITILGFKIYFYGILIMFGALAATWLAARRAKEYGQDPEMAWDILPWALIGGILGARIWHILTPPASMVEQGITTAYYLTHPIEMLNIRNGGLGIPGAVIGGFIAVLIYTRRKESSILTWADIIAPGLALAQAVGRWGNFFNQELYGAPTNLPWKLFIEPVRRLQEYANVEYYHPLFLYESIWNLLNAGLLIYFARRLKGWLKNGDLFLIYLIFYAVGRFSLEYLRLDPSPVAGINANQTLMVIVGIGAAAALIVRHRLAPAKAVITAGSAAVSAEPALSPNVSVPPNLSGRLEDNDSQEESSEEGEPAGSNE